MHAFIIWENARPKSQQIIDELKKNFEICKVYEIFWPDEKFTYNLKRFYGITLLNPSQKKSICGGGPFLLVAVLDKNPKHGKRKTSLGSQIVNTNIYDQKMQYRKMLGSGFIIHSSIHEKESNHDFTLLLGKNLEQLKNEFKISWNGKIEPVKTDLFGNRWNNPEEVFFTLNSTINYVVLRNFESFPEELTIESHKDVDLLTDDQWQIPYTLNMQRASSTSIGFSPFVKIGDKKIKFDIRYVGDKYYDEKWSKDILKRRVMSNNGIFVPSSEDHFFSLLYHMLIHKGRINKEYSNRLYSIAPQHILENYSRDNFDNLQTLKKILDEFLKKNNYMYTNSLSYKIGHNEIMRLSKVVVFTIKHEGWNYLFRAIKSKLKKTIKNEKNNHLIKNT